MIPIPRDFLEFLRLLTNHGVKHLLIGGYAVAHYGYVRATGDLDVFVEASPENAERLVKACREFGLGESVVECWESRNVVMIGDVEVPVISCTKLIQNKRASGRGKDLVDVEMLSEGKE